MKWFRFYADALHNPKVQRLPPETFKSWINVLCLAAESGGNLDQDIDNIAYSLRVDSSQAAKILSELEAAKLLDRTKRGLKPHNWDERQFRSDVSTSRVQKFRKQQRNGVGETTGNVSRNVSRNTIGNGPEQNRTDTEQIQNRSEIVHEDEFQRAWNRWPAKGRRREILCQQQWVQLFVTEAEPAELIRKIHRGIDRWLKSVEFEKGFVFGFADFLCNRRWNEDPEQSGDDGHVPSRSRVFDEA